MMARPKIEWPPPASKWPKGFSLHRDGCARSYRGITVVISGKTRKPAEVEQMFQDRCRIIDGGKPTLMPSGAGVTVKELAAAFFSDLEKRAERKDISERHVENLMTEARRFGKFLGGHRLAASVGPRDYAAYYNHVVKATTSPYTIENLVSRAPMMFKWAAKNGIIPPIVFGSSWRALPSKKRKAHRIRKEKTFSTERIAAIYRHCPPMWKRWMELGICGGFNNSDLANMTWEVFDGNIVDYRRRKDGEVRRVIWIPDEVMDRLKAYRRPKPASARYNDHVFLDDLGKPYDGVGQRSQSSNEFRQIAEEAGAYIKGRGFSGIRTTCYNELLYAPAIVRGLIIGHIPDGMSGIDWENYCERVDIEPVKTEVEKIWAKFRSLLSDDSPSASS
jgi:integrase